jgi:hypothetical protein
MPRRCTLTRRVAGTLASTTMSNVEPYLMSFCGFAFTACHGRRRCRSGDVVPVDPRRQSSRWLVFFSLAVGLLALGVAIGCWFRPVPDNKSPSASRVSTYSDQQAAEAKAKVCAAFDKVQHAVMATSARSGGDDPTAILAVATSGRQALEVGSRYLLAKLAEEPATPANLADIVRRVANLYQERTIDYLAEVSDAEIDQLRRVSDEATSMVERLCK